MVAVACTLPIEPLRKLMLAAVRECAKWLSASTAVACHVSPTALQPNQYRDYRDSLRALISADSAVPPMHRSSGYTRLGSQNDHLALRT
jgi:hypothetical protein